jgi:hypothetical protein
MGKAKQVKKFAAVKRILNPKDPRYVCVCVYTVLTSATCD